MTGIRYASGGGRFETVAAYSRAKRVGPFVAVAGTTAIEPSGRLHQPGDTYAQTIYAFQRIEAALNEVGAELKHVVRTRAFLTDMRNAGEFARAHGEIFADILPVTSAVAAGLTTAGMMVEIEADAIVHDSDGVIPY
ncbi:MAG: Rid family hydrolase [Rhodobacteraceae bacterium]|nr:Rid family hydrolase [Paracoccaceae bacterium]